MRSEDDILKKSSAESLEKRLQILIKKVARIEKFLREKEAYDANLQGKKIITRGD